MKKLRKKYVPKNPFPKGTPERLSFRKHHSIRYFQCGEYGEKTHRPHYHACLFNFDFADKKLWKIKNDNRLYTSDILSDLWPQGFSTIGDVTFDSAAYVARYIMKKITGEMAHEHYRGRKPEYTTMSRDPGIGSEWLRQFRTDVYPDDFVVINGKKVRPPKFYDTQQEAHDLENFTKIKNDRIIRGDKLPKKDKTDRRLLVRENVKTAQVKSLTREI